MGVTVFGWVLQEPDPRSPHKRVWRFFSRSYKLAPAWYCAFCVIDLVPRIRGYAAQVTVARMSQDSMGRLHKPEILQQVKRPFPSVAAAEAWATQKMRLVGPVLDSEKPEKVGAFLRAGGILRGSWPSAK